MSQTPDRIDQVLDDWRRERPDLDWSGAAIALRLVLLGKFLEQDASASFAPFDLQTGEFDVLATLRRQGAPYLLSAGELARSVLLTCSGMTHRLDRLEKRGLVERTDAAADRRRVMVRLTPAGKTLADRAMESRSRHICRLMEQLVAGQGDALQAQLRAMINRVDALMDAGTACGGKEGREAG